MKTTDILALDLVWKHFEKGTRIYVLSAEQPDFFNCSVACNTITESWPALHLIKGWDLRMNRTGAFESVFATFLMWNLSICISRSSKFNWPSFNSCMCNSWCSEQCEWSCLNLWGEQSPLKEAENKIYCIGENTLFIFNSATLSRGIRRAAQLRSKSVCVARLHY